MHQCQELNYPVIGEPLITQLLYDDVGTEPNAAHIWGLTKHPFSSLATYHHYVRMMSGHHDPRDCSVFSPLQSVLVS